MESDWVCSGHPCTPMIHALAALLFTLWDPPYGLPGRTTTMLENGTLWHCASVHYME